MINTRNCDHSPGNVSENRGRTTHAINFPTPNRKASMDYHISITSTFPRARPKTQPPRPYKTPRFRPIGHRQWHTLDTAKFAHPHTTPSDPHPIVLLLRTMPRTRAHLRVGKRFRPEESTRETNERDPCPRTHAHTYAHMCSPTYRSSRGERCRAYAREGRESSEPRSIPTD